MKSQVNAAQKIRENEPTGPVTLVSQDKFTEFISAPYTIIQAGDGETPDGFPFAITLRFGFFHIPPVRLGVVNLSTFEWDDLTKLYVLYGLQSIQMKPDALGRPPAGYYLFANGKLIRFHPGHVDLEKDGTPLGYGILTGLFGLLVKSTEVAELGLHIATWNAGDRVAEAFAQVIQQHFSNQFSASEKKAPPVEDWTNDALHRAYASLGLSPSATDQEVIAAHKRLVREHHPDRFANDTTKQEQATRRTAELNAARDFILKRQGRAAGAA